MTENMRKVEDIMRYDIDMSFRFPEDLQKRADENRIIMKKAIEKLENEINHGDIPRY